MAPILTIFLVLLSAFVFIQPQNYVRVRLSDNGRLIVRYLMRRKTEVYDVGELKTIYRGSFWGMNAFDTPWRPFTLRRNHLFTLGHVYLVKGSLKGRTRFFLLSEVDGIMKVLK